MEISALIEALSKPAAFPYAVECPEVIHTHISVVFRAGPFVYKIKKPVQPGFLDFSSLEKRRFFCEEEIRLNRRLAPDVYLGVVPVTAADGRARFEGAGEAIEWAVKMARLPDEATLHARLERGEGDRPLAEALSGRIAAFHREAHAASQSADFDAVRRNLQDVLRLSEPLVGKTVSQEVYQRLTTLTEEHLNRLQPLIEARAARGMTRDCHGDLHLDHIYYFPERQPPGDFVIVDCVEFNERFRFIDPVADMAFAAMDFVYHGRAELADAFCNAYFRESEDAEGRVLLPLYMSYRAAVRASVDGMKAREPEVPESQRRRARASSRAHWQLALAQLESASNRPCLLLVGGLPGTGKSTLARNLSTLSGFEVVRSDVVRKRLARTQRRGDFDKDALYSAKATARTYSACLRLALRHLFQGRRVLIDATFRRDKHRRAFVRAARRICVPVGMLICQADPATVRARLAQRLNDVSDADWVVYQMAATDWEPPAPQTDALVRYIDTSGSETDALTKGLAALKELGLARSEKQENEL